MRSSLRVSLWIVTVVILLAASLPGVSATENTAIYDGLITDVSLTDSTVTVRHGILSKTFRVTRNTSIVTTEKGGGSSLNDLRANFDVVVTYTGTDTVADAEAIKQRQSPKE